MSLVYPFKPIGLAEAASLINKSVGEFKALQIHDSRCPFLVFNPETKEWTYIKEQLDQYADLLSDDMEERRDALEASRINKRLNELS